MVLAHAGHQVDRPGVGVSGVGKSTSQAEGSQIAGESLKRASATKPSRPLRNPARWKDSAPRHDTSWKDLMSDINVEPTAKRPRILAIEFQAKPDADRSGTDSQTVGRGADLYNDG
eukprot:Platyproteum_vivax@DN7634_c1_g4_i12.p1